MNDEFVEKVLKALTLAAMAETGMTLKASECIELHNEILELDREITSLKEEAQWFTLKEKMPAIETTDVGGEYLVKLGGVYDRVAPMNWSEDCGFFSGGWGTSITSWNEHVTHWRYLPAGPVMGDLNA